MPKHEDIATRKVFAEHEINAQKAYIGPFGYTIPKSGMSPETLAFIEEKCVATPYTPGAPIPVGGAASFPIYRKSSSKIYLPRYLGEFHFGPVSSTLSCGDDINLTFNGRLFDYQAPVMEAFMRNIEEGGTGGLLELHTGWGKTAAALYAIAKIGKKTLVIVHKEFLMNQWRERIETFLPGARIGRIQGSEIDIEDKDVVLCMLKSLSMKDYPKGTFSSFGFSIIDEVHHMASETFSNALFRVVTPYMLGLSATMNRKDGTSYVFKLFLGPILHTAVRDASSGAGVVVHTIGYSHSDAEFNDIPLDFRGKPQLSTMVSTLCTFVHRTNFIIDMLSKFILAPAPDDKVAKWNAEAAAHKQLLDDSVANCVRCNRKVSYHVQLECCNSNDYCFDCIQTLNLNPKSPGISAKTGKPLPPIVRCPSDSCTARPKKQLRYKQLYMPSPYVQPYTQRQTLVLANNLSVLHFMYARIVSANIASVGYYVGGMTEAQLKESESCQIILATYQMASEGLDIRSLNALFLITPMTDITQAVGRILRAKHAFPVIVDIVDSHEPFQNQARKRRAFFKSQGYTIYRVSMAEYLAVSSYFQRHGVLIKEKEEEDSDDEKSAAPSVAVAKASKLFARGRK